MHRIKPHAACTCTNIHKPTPGRSLSVSAPGRNLAETVLKRASAPRLVSPASTCPYSAAVKRGDAPVRRAPLSISARSSHRTLTTPRWPPDAGRRSQLSTAKRMAPWLKPNQNPKNLRLRRLRRTDLTQLRISCSVVWGQAVYALAVVNSSSST